MLPTKISFVINLMVIAKSYYQHPVQFYFKNSLYLSTTIRKMGEQKKNYREIILSDFKTLHRTTKLKQMLLTFDQFMINSSDLFPFEQTTFCHRGN